ncbi:SDR family NAD(P)-dependent oxidoreductase [Bacteriovorax sp. Seq25_V]|uniref:SDR family NAD(P)-dependent oxidoreductase n=1 Tax=Bacteriovorax sp. Seq25_V TaxID=1201288 RepID=UPI000389DD53|nr:SDR family NAD(P)-dependent oxidoreductase [Bacteriovorax sp. Seq25_V]EQC47723.1 oxidoreductase, short chain dehydrogenase/reductase family protein [Bacteriovorax sp. Seq25_V]
MSSTLITGGLNGIGKEIAIQIDGKKIITTSQRNKVDERADIYYLNLKEIESIKELAKKLKENNIEISKIYHCAYDFSDAKLFFSIKSQELSEKFQSNIVGTFELLKTFLKPMTRKGQGSVLLLGSLLAKFPAPGKLIYITEKNALEAMASAINSEVNNKGVFVKIIHPGLVATEQVLERISKDVIDKIGKDNLLNPKDVANRCIEFLESNDQESTLQMRGNQTW